MVEKQASLAEKLEKLFDEVRKTTPAMRGIATELFSEGCKMESPGLILGKNASAGEGAQHAVERLRMYPGSSGQFIRGFRVCF
jgi:hypothetical protein